MNPLRHRSKAILILFISLVIFRTSAIANAIETLINRGQYQLALKKLPKNKSQAAYYRAQIALAKGQYPKAIKEAKAAMRQKSLRTHALTIIGLSEKARGQYQRAEQSLLKAKKLSSKNLLARIELAKLYLLRGKKSDAKAIFDQFYNDYDNDKINLKSAKELSYVAMACRYTDNYRDAYTTLKEALKYNKNYLPAYNELGELSLEKYQADHAEAHFQHALKINPKNLRALIGLTEVLYQKTNKLKPLIDQISKIRKINPYSVDADALEARALIDNDAYHQAEKLITNALKRNPNHLKSLSLLAASYFIRDQKLKYQTIERRVLKLSPHDSTFYLNIIKLAVRKHRYAESIELGKAALKINSADWYAMAEIGRNYLRMNNEKEGLKWLKNAWDGDQYNKQTFYLLNLFEDVIEPEYAFTQSKHFRLRSHKSELPLLKRIILPLLEEGYALYQKKYNFHPKKKVQIELYQKPSHFSIRTFGLPPDPGALGGVCFGTLITSMSPSLQRFNWGQVLWHELNHVFTVELSNHRVPRWLTEGLAVLEPPLKRKEWKREMDFKVYQAIKRGSLTPLNAMNQAFTRQGLSGVLLAYYHGGLLARFFVERYGLKRMQRVLKAYAQGKRTKEIFEKVYGKSVDALNKEFISHERQRLSFYQKNYYVDLDKYLKLAKWKTHFEKEKDNANALIDYGLALISHHRIKTLKKLKQKIHDLNTGTLKELYLKIHVDKFFNKAKHSKSLLTQFIKNGGDGYFARFELGAIYLKEKDFTKAARELSKAKQFDPEEKAPYELLYRAYRAEKKRDKAVIELMGIVERNQQSFRYAQELIRELHELKRWKDIRHYGKMAFFIQPFSAKLHLTIAEAYKKAAPKVDLKRAKWHLETALLIPNLKPEMKKLLQRKLSALNKRGN